jgi:biopolymer transport protein ExbD
MKRTLLLVASALLLPVLLFFAFFQITASGSKPVQAQIVTESATSTDDRIDYQLHLNAEGFGLKAGAQTIKGSYNDLQAALADIAPALKETELLVRVQKGASFEQVSKTLDLLIALGLPRYRLVNDK